jgi:hypothetical protein
MEKQELIIVEVFCKEYQIEIDLIDEMESFGLINTVVQNKNKYIPRNQLVHLEKIIRLHNDLNINKEGIEIILNLLEIQNQLNKELKYLKDRLSLYE